MLLDRQHATGLQGLEEGRHIGVGATVPGPVVEGPGHDDQISGPIGHPHAVARPVDGDIAAAAVAGIGLQDATPPASRAGLDLDHGLAGGQAPEGQGLERMTRGVAGRVGRRTGRGGDHRPQQFILLRHRRNHGQRPMAGPGSGGAGFGDSHRGQDQGGRQNEGEQTHGRTPEGDGQAGGFIRRMAGGASHDPEHRRPFGPAP